MSYTIGPEDLEALLLGGCFFGSGGGGTVRSARSLVSHFQPGAYYPSTSVRIVDVDDASDGDAVMVAYLGAPVAIDGATYPIGPVLAAQRLAQSGRRLGYIVPPESGALGFVVACLVAARLGLAVIDADGAGRAVPSLPQLTFAAAEIDPRPAFLVSQRGLSVELGVTPLDPGTSDGTAAPRQDVAAIIDQLMRPIVAQKDFAEFGGLAMWIMAPQALRRALPIRGTLTRALTMGRALRAGELPTAEAAVGFLAQRFDLVARVLFPLGSFTSARMHTAGGFDLGALTLQSGARCCTVLYQNESLLAWDAAAPAPIGMAPDSLCYFVEGADQQVYSNGDLVDADGRLTPACGALRVTLLGLKAAPPLRQPGSLILSSFMELLAAIGYLGPYLPLEGGVGGRP
jgi:DUF917 family protein